jgi:hypothetical protein
MIMDLHVMWFRGRIIRRIGAKLALVATVLTVATAVAAWAGAGTGPAASAGLGVLVGATVSLGWLALAIFTNPIDHRYLRAYLDEDVEVRVPETSPLPPPLTEGKTRPVFSLHDRTGDAVVCSVYSAGHIIASRSGVTDATVLYSRLVDGRTVVTDTQLSVPRSGCIANLCRGGDLAALAECHQELLDTLANAGLLIDPSPDPKIVVEHLCAEREAFRQLGSILGCFVAVDGRRTAMDLTVDIDPAELLGLHGLRPRREEGRRRVLEVEPTGNPAAATGRTHAATH